MKKRPITSTTPSTWDQKMKRLSGEDLEAYYDRRRARLERKAARRAMQRITILPRHRPTAAGAARSRQFKYNLKPEQILEMLATQIDKCAICSRPFLGRKFVVDHCHKTDLIRGLLCHQCNVGLGMFKDSVATLIGAAKYLRRNR